MYTLVYRNVMVCPFYFCHSAHNQARTKHQVAGGGGGSILPPHPLRILKIGDLVMFFVCLGFFLGECLFVWLGFFFFRFFFLGGGCLSGFALGLPRLLKTRSDYVTYLFSKANTVQKVREIYQNDYQYNNKHSLMIR